MYNNMSSVLTRIKSTLGLYTIALPFENVDQVLSDIIINVTLPVFSTYSPYREKLRVDTKELTELERADSYQTFLLPDWKNKHIIMVEDVEYDETMLSGFGYYGGFTPFFTNNMLQQSLLANVGANISRSMIPKMTFEYEHPRKLRIWNLFNSCKLVLKVCCMHHPSLASISPTTFESFYKLALLDVEMFLYNTMKHYNNVESAYGRIDLKIDEWQNAEAERKELIDKWDDSYHLDFQSIYYA